VLPYVVVQLELPEVIYLALAGSNMLNYLQNTLMLSPLELTVSVAVVFVAGMVRGFAGFGLSALVMAGLALIIPPVSLIPVCFMLEGTASMIMIRGGFKNADRKIAYGLAIGSAIGVPFGLLTTMNVSVDTSRLLALSLILVLAFLQLVKKSPAFLATRPGLYITGLVAGFATGIASVGGMVVALYVLAQQAPAARMRASLVLFLFLGLFTSVIWLSLSGMLDALAIKRASFLVPVVIAGVLTGSYLFRPSLEGLYKRFCLVLLIGLAITGLLRQLLV